MKQLKQQRGFTVLEVILAVVIGGFLMFCIMPSFASILTDSTKRSGDAVVRTVQTAVNAQVSANKIMGVTPVVPMVLDAVVGTTAGKACTTTVPCFTNILPEVILPSGWKKLSSTNSYSYNGTTYRYVRNSTKGYGCFTTGTTCP